MSSELRIAKVHMNKIKDIEAGFGPNCPNGCCEHKEFFEEYVRVDKDHYIAKENALATLRAENARLRAVAEAARDLSGIEACGGDVVLGCYVSEYAIPLRKLRAALAALAGEE